MKITDEMVGRANAVLPDVPFGTVCAMLEAAVAGVGVPYEERMKIQQEAMAKKLPDAIGALARCLRLHSLVLVYHNGLLENAPVQQTAAEALQAGIDYWAQGQAELGVVNGGDAAGNLSRAVHGWLEHYIWDASPGWDAIASGSHPANAESGEAGTIFLDPQGVAPC